MSQNYQLYGRPGSGSFAVQVALEEAQAPYERIWVGREPEDVEKLARIVPTAKVPALVLPDGTILFESAAMLMHLALEFPQSALGPKPGSAAHALFLQWTVFLSANVYEAALRVYYPERYTSRGAVDAEVVKAQGTADFRRHLAVIESALDPYVLGDAYSIADVYLYMLGTWYPGDRQELYAQLPALGAHATLLARRAAVAKVEADHAQ